MLTNLSPLEIVVVLVAILVSMAMHEAMHAFTAHALGDPTAQLEGRLTLNPLKHIDIFTTVLLPVALIAIGLPPFFVARPVPFNPAQVKFGEYGAALVGIAGPLTNLVLAALVAGVLHLFGAAISGTLANSLVIFVAVNIGFFVFNMIPFPPLDGSRLLYALAPEWLQKIMYQIESAGFFAILAFMLLAFQFISPAIIHIESVLMRFFLA